jgi:hypothetical protein
MPVLIGIVSALVVATCIVISARPGIPVQAALYQASPSATRAVNPTVAPLPTVAPVAVTAAPVTTPAAANGSSPSTGPSGAANPPPAAATTAPTAVTPASGANGASTTPAAAAGAASSGAAQPAGAASTAATSAGGAASSSGGTSAATATTSTGGTAGGLPGTIVITIPQNAAADSVLTGTLNTPLGTVTVRVSGGIAGGGAVTVTPSGDILMIVSSAGTRAAGQTVQVCLASACQSVTLGAAGEAVLTLNGPGTVLAGATAPMPVTPRLPNTGAGPSADTGSSPAGRIALIAALALLVAGAARMHRRATRTSTR